MTQAVTTSFPFPRTAHFCPVGAKSGREPCFRLCSLEVGSIFPFVSQSPLLGIRLIIAHQIQCRIDLQFILCGLVENEAIQTHIPDDMQYSALWIQVIQAYFLISSKFEQIGQSKADKICDPLWRHREPIIVGGRVSLLIPSYLLALRI